MTGSEPLQQQDQQTAPATPIAIAAVIIMAGSVLSRLVGLLREQITAGLYGTGDEIAAYTIAENVLNLLLELVASGMLFGALIPVLAALVIVQSGSLAELNRVSGALLALALLVVTPAVIAGIIFAPAVVRFMTAFGGEQERSTSTVDLTVDLVRITMPALLFLAAGTILMAALFALQRPAAPSFAGAVRSGGAILAMVLLNHWIGIKGLAVGAVVGSVLLVASQLPALRRAGAMPVLNLGFDHPAVRKTLRLYLPIFAGLLVSTATVVLDRNLAWGAEVYALGAMRYATMLAQLLMGLVAAAVSLAILPRLAGLHAAGDEAGFQRLLANGLAMVSYLIIPSVLTMAVLAGPVVTLLFAHGSTTQADGDHIALALLGYLPGHLLAAFDQLLIVAFYARQKTVQPVLVGMVAALVYVASALLLVAPYGMMGLVAANSIQFAVHTLIMIWLTRRETGAAAFAGVSRVVANSLILGTAMAGAALLVWWLLEQLLPAPAVAAQLGQEFLLVALPASAAALIYLLGLRRLRVPQIEALVAQLRARLQPGDGAA